jgi:hypothetical protein
MLSKEVKLNGLPQQVTWSLYVYKVGCLTIEELRCKEKPTIGKS